MTCESGHTGPRDPLLARVFVIIMVFSLTKELQSGSVMSLLSKGIFAIAGPCGFAGRLLLFPQLR